MSALSLKSLSSTPSEIDSLLQSRCLTPTLTLKWLSQQRSIATNTMQQLRTFHLERTFHHQHGKMQDLNFPEPSSEKWPLLHHSENHQTTPLESTNPTSWVRYPALTDVQENRLNELHNNASLFPYGTLHRQVLSGRFDDEPAQQKELYFKLKQLPETAEFEQLLEAQYKHKHGLRWIHDPQPDACGRVSAALASIVYAAMLASSLVLFLIKGFWECHTTQDLSLIHI